MHKNRELTDALLSDVKSKMESKVSAEGFEEKIKKMID